MTFRVLLILHTVFYSEHDISPFFFFVFLFSSKRNTGWALPSLPNHKIQLLKLLIVLPTVFSDFTCIAKLEGVEQFIEFNYITAIMHTYTHIYILQYLYAVDMTILEI